MQVYVFLIKKNDYIPNNAAKIYVIIELVGKYGHIEPLLYCVGMQIN